MQVRKHEDWLKSYMGYVRDTESPSVYHVWTGLSCISAVLGKKVKLQSGRLNIFPNLYVVLVGTPGLRKSQAIRYGSNLIKPLEIPISADSTTREMLIKDLAASTDIAVSPEGEDFPHSSLTILSNEFESFLGQKSDNAKMLVLLTDLFDYEGLWSYRTKNAGVFSVADPCLNILAATTPSSISDSLPIGAIGGGLTSRMIFAYARKNKARKAIPEDPPAELVESLIHDLSSIGKIVGTYHYSAEARSKFIDWYESYNSNNNVCKDILFAGWYTRYHLFVQKIAILCAASESSDLILHWRHFQRAIGYLVPIEEGMSGAFSSVGRSDVGPEVDLVMNYVESKRWVTETELRKLTLRDIDEKKFINVISTVLKACHILRCYEGPNDVKTTWFVWAGFVDEWKKAGGKVRVR